MNQYNGGFSDFNGLGLYSGLLFLYLVMYVLKLSYQKGVFREYALEFIFLPVTLLGIILSGSRTALAFVLVSVGVFLFSKKIKFLSKVILLSCFVALILFSGGTLKKRMYYSINQLAKLFQSDATWKSLDKFSNHRIKMIENSIPMIYRFPVAGVGCGNFLSYLGYQNYGEKYVEDLPLNQFLLIWDEIGIFGLIFFILILFHIIKPRGHLIFYTILWVMVVMLLVNTYFWLPEAIILFWIVSVFNVNGSESLMASSKKKSRLLMIFMFSIFLGMNMYQYSSLHPLNLAHQKKVMYDYGFWYTETGDQGDFNWSRHRAGVFLPKSSRYKIAIFCGAPLEEFRGKQQHVYVYWRGKQIKKIVFLENRMEELVVNSDKGGFLEFKVNPVFNLKSLGLGSENRTLGVQFYHSVVLLPEKR